MTETQLLSEFVHWFRQSSPYIHAFRHRTFVVAFDGVALLDTNFPLLIHDIALLNSLGIQLVLVHGAREQIEQHLNKNNIKMAYENDVRITNDAALMSVKEAVGRVRLDIEALLSMGLANSPMAGAQVRVTSGNVVIARPLGIKDGIDYGHTGEVRRIDSQAIKHALKTDAIVLLSPLGYSPTGEIFNLTANEVATATAVALQADKLIFLTEGDEADDNTQQTNPELTLQEAQDLMHQHKHGKHHYLACAVKACRQGVKRTHLINRHINGGLLQELFTRDGIGTLVSAENYEDIRQASMEDIGGILEIIEPLEQAGVLVRRSREQLELEINDFTLIHRDGATIGCASLHPYIDEQIAEIACLAVRPEYRTTGRGDRLLSQLERRAKQQGMKQIFVLTTQTAHWFQERGYQLATVAELPVKKQNLYNYQRRSKVFIKNI